MALKPTAPAKPAEPTKAAETTDVEDIVSLGDAVVALCQTPAYDDMTWPELDRAFMRASHLLKVNFMNTGTNKPLAPPEPPPER